MKLAEKGSEHPAVGSSSFGLAKSSEIYLCFHSLLAKYDSLYLYQEIQFDFFFSYLSGVFPPEIGFFSILLHCLLAAY